MRERGGEEEGGVRVNGRERVKWSEREVRERGEGDKEGGRAEGRVRRDRVGMVRRKERGESKRGRMRRGKREKGSLRAYW